MPARSEPETDLVRIFRRLKALLKKYEKPPLLPKIDLNSRYDLWSVKDLVVEGRPRKEISFATLIIQSRYVGFYFMPVYAEADLAKVFKPELLKLKTGKSCFHITALDARLEKAIAEALAKGYAIYRNRGWV
jgi:hypothetical protein